MKCLDALREFKQQYLWRRMAPRREMASLVGQLSFSSNAIPAGRCFLSRLFQAIHEVGEEKTGKAEDYDRRVKVTGAAALDMKWWQACLERGGRVCAFVAHSDLRSSQVLE